ncbi:hypothetical protein BKA70DRAFT_1299343 [Coprinopsis sp. MPI-PUGE-AT-0042]|nr:hypothetical protein BKA70DRAFT_1299343 [Coprinopsis sp. MPI-PUGE-AT-0042]
MYCNDGILVAHKMAMPSSAGSMSTPKSSGRSKSFAVPSRLRETYSNGNAARASGISVQQIRASSADSTPKDRSMNVKGANTSTNACHHERASRGSWVKVRLLRFDAAFAIVNGLDASSMSSTSSGSVSHSQITHRICNVSNASAFQRTSAMISSPWAAKRTS